MRRIPQPSSTRGWEAFRLRWDLADVESCVRDLRAPHTESEDTRAAWDAVRAVLDPTPDVSAGTVVNQRVDNGPEPAYRRSQPSG